MAERVIYDLGANTGMNIPYYLRKAERVVAVEANPDLAEGLRVRFATEVAEGRVVVVDRAVTAHDRAGEPVEFFVYRGDKPNGHVASSLRRPREGREADFRSVVVATVDLPSLVEQHGEPYFVKIDLEHHDTVVLGDLLRSGLRPPLLSVEAHDPAVVAHLILATEYRGFQLVDGRTVHVDFIAHPIRTTSGLEQWDFPKHAAGPFGDDLPGPWLDRVALLRVLGRRGPGWVDVHASTEHVGGGWSEPPAASPEGVLNPLRGAGRLALTAARRAPGAIIRRLVSG